MHPNGNTYIGHFKEGLKNGNGTFYWFSNHELFTGDWQGGLPHGTGIYIGKDKYEGNFLNGLKFGFGEETFSNSDKYIGISIVTQDSMSTVLLMVMGNTSGLMAASTREILSRE